LIEDPTIVITIGVVIPNIFTPNGDDKNEYFYISGLNQFENPKIKIYNRWGNLVYESDSYKNDWDGTSEASMTIGKKEKLPTGTYFYVLELMKNYAPITGWIYLDR